ncbi:MAG: hypothetical protein OHK0044_32290 [Burkholderiaceae bacterium]
MARAAVTTRVRQPLLAVAALAGTLGVAAAAWWGTPSKLPTRELVHPAAPGARLPRLAAHPGGSVVLSWVEAAGDAHVLKYAAFAGGGFGAAVEVARGRDWFINWIDFPSVVPIDRDFWLAHWLARRGAGKYDYDIALAVSEDGGRTWRAGPRPHASDVPAEYGFASIFAERDGAAGIVWLDGRDYVKPSQRHLYPGKSGNFAMRYARLERGGRVTPDRVLDGNVCTCCQTAAAVTARGPAVAYRARTEAEVRDNALVRKLHDGWSTPAPLGGEGWVIAGCPTNGPALAARGEALLAAWFTGEGDVPRVRAAVSRDGAATFAPIVELDRNAPVGRLAAAWIDEERAAVAWIGKPGEDGRAPLWVATLNRAGALRGRAIATRVAATRDSGIPQLAVAGGELLIAVTDPAPAFGVRVLAVSAARLP